MTLPRIVLADDHRMFSEGLKRLLEDEFDVVALVEDGETLLAAVEEHAPDLVITDVTMPGLNGIECLRRLRDRDPELHVVILTMHDDVALAASALRAGASGYVLKNGGTREVLRAIEEALGGGVHVSTQIAREVLTAVASGKDAKPELTERQGEILRLLVEGLSAKQIAARVHISPRTVEYHKYQAMERLGVTTNAELIAYGLKHGFGPDLPAPPAPGAS